MLLLIAEKTESVTEDGLNIMKLLNPDLNYLKIEESRHSIHKTNTKKYCEEVIKFFLEINNN
jgi:hypothetical protein